MATTKYRFRSDFEKRIHEQLKKLKIKHEYEPTKIEYRRTVSKGICTKCGETRVYQRRTYLPDFVCESGVIIEVKGRLIGADRAKLQALKQQHPNIDIRLVFGSNNKIVKNKPEWRYLDWAKKYKIKAALKEVPLVWVKDLVIPRGSCL